MAKPREIVVALFLSFVSGTILGLAVTHASDRLGDIPIEVRPHVGAALAAGCTDNRGSRSDSRMSLGHLSAIKASEWLHL
jgi:hypothetical protein